MPLPIQEHREVIQRNRVSFGLLIPRNIGCFFAYGLILMLIKGVE